MGSPRHVCFKVMRQDFWVDKKFKVTKELGQGAYGVVAAAKAMDTGEAVAIKKVTNIFTKKILTKRALRELKLLKHFRGHKNIICLYDMDIIDKTNFDAVYLYIELLEADLHAIIQSRQPLSDAHYQSFIYQALCGLKYIHSANVLHRDLKPGNLLVNADCELKICDFGLARGFSDSPEENAGYMTEYVATRWYRAPEIMLSFQSYTRAIDMWSVGCILAELLGGRPFFKGKDYVDQLNQILDVLGIPDEDTLARISSQRAREYVKSLPRKPKVPFETLFPKANPQALDLLEKLLAFDPNSRITVEQALEHPYLSIWHDPTDEPACPQSFDFGFEAVNDIPQMREMIVDEVVQFRQLVRSQNLEVQIPLPGSQTMDIHNQSLNSRPHEVYNAMLHPQQMNSHLHSQQRDNQQPTAQYYPQYHQQLAQQPEQPQQIFSGFSSEHISQYGHVERPPPPHEQGNVGGAIQNNPGLMDLERELAMD